MTSKCQWCVNPLFMESHLETYLSIQRKCLSSRPSEPTIEAWCYQAYQDLKACFECVVTYHNTINEALQDANSNVMTTRGEIYLADIERLKSSFSSVLDSDVADVELSSFPPFKEILKYPLYLLSKPLSSLVVRFICTLLLEDCDLHKLDIEQDNGIFPGIYLLLIHPVERVQRWAIETVKSLDPIDSMTFEEIEVTIKWIMSIIKYDLLENPQPENEDLCNLDPDEVVLPSHLIPSNSHKTFWIGICMLIKSMDKNCIQSKLLSSTSNHRQLMDAIINALQQSSDELSTDDNCRATSFWPVLQIIFVLLEYQGAFFWQSTNRHPAQVCKLILGHRQFASQLQCLAEQVKMTREDDSYLTNSQCVYSSNSGGAEVQYCQPSSSSSSEANIQEFCYELLVLSWIPPFVSSIIGFGDVFNQVLHKILAALCSIFIISISPNPQVKSSKLLGLNLPKFKYSSKFSITKRLSNVTLEIFSEVIEILFSKEFYKFLHSKIGMWLPVFSSACTVFIPLMKSEKKLDSGFEAVRKVMFSIINCSVGQELLNHSQFVVLLRPNLSRTFQTVIPKPPSINFIQDNITTILSICQSRQDLAGPFLSLQKPTQRQHVRVKQERQDDDYQNISSNLDQSVSLLSTNNPFSVTEIKNEPSSSRISLHVDQPVSPLSAPEIKNEPSPSRRLSLSRRRKKSCSSWKHATDDNETKNGVVNTDSVRSTAKISSNKNKCTKRICLDSDESSDNSDINEPSKCNKDVSSDRLATPEQKKKHKRKREKKDPLEEKQSKKRERLEKQHNSHETCGRDDVIMISSDSDSADATVDLTPQRKAGKSLNIVRFLKSNPLFDDDMPCQSDINVTSLDRSQIIECQSVPASCSRMETETHTEWFPAEANYFNALSDFLGKKTSRQFSLDLDKESDDSNGSCESSDDKLPSMKLCDAIRVVSEISKDLVSEKRVSPGLSNGANHLQFDDQSVQPLSPMDIDLCSETESVSTREVFYSEESSVSSDSETDNCIYNKLFRLPSCASVGREVITQPFFRLKPVKLELEKMTPEIVRKTIKEFQQGNKTSLSPHTRYSNECQEFVYNNQGIVRERELIVSIDLPLQNPDQSVDQVVLGDQTVPVVEEQTSSNTECPSKKKDGRSNDKYPTSDYLQIQDKMTNCGEEFVIPIMNNTKSIVSASSTDVQKSNICQTTKKAGTSGVVQRPRFSHSRLPSFNEVDATNRRESPTTHDAMQLSSVNKSNSTSCHTKTVVEGNVVPPVDSSLLPCCLSSSGNNHHQHVVTVRKGKVCTKWQPSSLLNQILNLPIDAFNTRIPSHSSNDSVLLVEKPSQIPDTFSNWKEYYDKFVSLSLIELQEDIIRQFSKTRDALYYMEGTLIPPVMENMIRCEVKISKKDRDNLNDRDLVRLDLYPTVAQTVPSRFSLISGMKIISNKVTQTCFDENGDANYTMEIKLQLAIHEPLHSIHITKVAISHVLNLTAYIRLWTVFCNFGKSLLLTNILYPRGGIYFGTTSNGPSHLCSEDNVIWFGKVLNVCQKSAVESAVNLVTNEYIHPRILLVKGSPGTGKTHTVVSMVNSILKELKQILRTRLANALPGNTAKLVRSPHILLCAPTNSALDEIIRRLIKDGVVYDTPEWRKDNRIYDADLSWSNVDGIKMVRLGDYKKISEDVRCVFTNSTVTRKYDKGEGEQILKLEQEIKNYEACIGELKVKLLQYKFMNSNDEGELHIITTTKEEEDLNNQINQKITTKMKLEEQMKKLRHTQKTTYDVESKNLKKKLMEADVVCCTLTTSGRNELHDYFRNPMHFSCVIIDEASYCTEIDTIFPLSFCSTKLILVGDPAGFPSMVKSNMATELGLGRSLFNRVLHVLNTTEENHTKVLKFQYRMSKPICSIFTDSFYSLNPMHTSTCPQLSSNLLPFNVFDIQNGMGTNHLCNEMQILEKIVKQLIEECISQLQIGIITPYRVQERQIQASLRKRFGCRKIEIGNTEDFQGREKMIMILFCAKPKETSIPIGFLSNTQKMTIALSRASAVLYIIAECGSLIANKDWNVLINRAKEMGNYTKCTSSSEIKNIILQNGYNNPDSTTNTRIVTRYRDEPSPSETQVLAEFSTTIHDPRGQTGQQSITGDKYQVSLYNSNADSNPSVKNTSSQPPPRPQPQSHTNMTHMHEIKNTSCMNGQVVDKNRTPVNSCSVIDHEPVCHWPDSQSIRISESTALIDYNRTFSPPPSGSVLSHRGGPKTRIARTSTN